MRTIISKMTHPYLMIHQSCKVKGSINNSIIWPLFKTFKANYYPRVDMADKMKALIKYLQLSISKIIIVPNLDYCIPPDALATLLKCDQDISEACGQPNAK